MSDDSHNWPHPVTRYERLAEELVVAALAEDEDAYERILDELGTCIDCNHWVICLLVDRLKTVLVDQSVLIAK